MVLTLWADLPLLFKQTIMSTFKINGGKQLKGELIPQGAKNEALQILSAVLLTPEEVEISNIPDIRDVMKLIELLGDLGVEVKKINADTYTFKAQNVNLEYLLSDDFANFVEQICNE